MRRVLKAAAGLALALTALALTFGAERAPAPVLDVREASVTLGAYEGGVFYRFCSGALVEGVVVTAGHCVLHATTVLVQMSDGYVYTGYVLDAVQEWPTLDHATVYLPIARGLYPSLVRGDGMEVGEDLYAWSGPWGLGELLLHGTYAGRIASDDSIPGSLQGFHYADMNAAGGSSGSVIINERGQAEAILVGAFGEDNRSLRLTGSLLVDLP